VLRLRSFSVPYNHRFGGEQLSPPERLSRPSQSFSHACKVRIPDSYEHRSCVAISHIDIACLDVTSWPHAPCLNATMSLEILYFHIRELGRSCRGSRLFPAICLLKLKPASPPPARTSSRLAPVFAACLILCSPLLVEILKALFQLLAARFKPDIQRLLLQFGLLSTMLSHASRHHCLSIHTYCLRTCCPLSMLRW
jgi:hypothetical protein